MTQNPTLSEREALIEAARTVVAGRADYAHAMAEMLRDADPQLAREHGRDRDLMRALLDDHAAHRAPVAPAEPVAEPAHPLAWVVSRGPSQIVMTSRSEAETWRNRGANIEALVPLSYVATPAQPSTVTAVKDEDIPALLRTAIRHLEAYDAPKRSTMLDLASHLRGVLEIPHEAEEVIRRCASIDSNGYIAEKAAIIAALRASTINAPPATSPVTPEAATLDAVKATAWSRLCEVDDRTSPEEYPDMLLVTQDELFRAMDEASITPSPVTGALVERDDEQRFIGIGMVLAASHVMSGHGEDTIAAELLEAAGLMTREAVAAIGIEDYDIKILKPVFAALAAQKAEG